MHGSRGSSSTQPAVEPLRGVSNLPNLQATILQLYLRVAQRLLYLFLVVDARKDTRPDFPCCDTLLEVGVRLLVAGNMQPLYEFDDLTRRNLPVLNIEEEPHEPIRSHQVGELQVRKGIPTRFILGHLIVLAARGRELQGAVRHVVNQPHPFGRRLSCLYLPPRRSIEPLYPSLLHANDALSAGITRP